LLYKILFAIFCTASEFYSCNCLPTLFHLFIFFSSGCCIIVHCTGCVSRLLVGLKSMPLSTRSSLLQTLHSLFSNTKLVKVRTGCTKPAGWPEVHAPVHTVQPATDPPLSLQQYQACQGTYRVCRHCVAEPNLDLVRSGTYQAGWIKLFYCKVFVL
jgi:hypothetical protein